MRCYVVPVMARSNSTRLARISQASRAEESNLKIYFVLWLLSILCYTNSLTGEFVFDDHEVIETNVDIRPKSPFMSIFEHDFWGDSIYSNTSHKSYRPVTIITFRWNFLFGGLDPTFYHVVNVCLHATVTVLFASTCLVLFTGLTSSNTCTLLAGLLFATHPLHTEAVASVVGRADLLSAFFYLLSFLSYTKSTIKTANLSGSRPASHSWAWIIVSIILCVLSVLSKEQGVTVIAVCMMYDLLYVCSIEPKDIMSIIRNPVVVIKSYKLWPKWVRRLLERLTVLMLSCIALLYIRIVVIGGGVPKTFVESDNPTFFDPNVWTRFRTYLYLCAFNAWLLSCPSTLCFDWSMDSIARIETLSDTRNLATCGFVVILGLLCFKGLISYSSYHTNDKERVAVADGKSTSRDMNRNLTDKVSRMRQFKSNNVQRKNFSDALVGRTILQGLCMLIIPFIPASNLFFPVGFVVAERVLYIPSMGFCILAALGITGVFGKHNAKQLTEQDESDKHHGVSSLLTLGLTVKGRLLFYALLLMFTTKTLQRNAEWQDDGSLAVAGLKVNPTNAKIHLCMGNYLAKKGLRSCEVHYREALRLRPHYTLAWVNLGLVLLNTDRPQEAEYCYSKALSINPNSANANTNMANLLRLDKRYKQAEIHYRKALASRTEDPMLFFYLGLVLEKLGKHKEAKKNYLKSITLMPSHSKGYFAVARLLIDPMNEQPVDSAATMKTIATAEEYLQIGLRYDKNDYQARLLLAKLLLKRGNLALAKSELFFVLSHDQTNIEAKYLVGQVMERDGKTDEAEKLYQTILDKHNHTKTIRALERLTHNRKLQY